MIKPKKFFKWVKKAIQFVGDGEAYCFNLYEDEKAWSCEFISSTSYDSSEDGDWVCDEKEIYGRDKPLLIANKSDIRDYIEVLKMFKELLEEALIGCSEFKELSAKKPIAYGFVDGDINLFTTNG